VLHPAVFHPTGFHPREAPPSGSASTLWPTGGGVEVIRRSAEVELGREGKKKEKCE
jgi:hypothetical protein